MTVPSTTERLWRVLAIETHAMPRSHTNGQPAGLLLQQAGFLQSDQVAPETGEVLEVVGGDTPNVKYFGTAITVEEAKAELTKREKN